MAHGRRALAYVLAAKMAGYGTLNKKERNGQVDAHTHAVCLIHIHYASSIMGMSPINHSGQCFPNFSAVPSLVDRTIVLLRYCFKTELFNTL